MFRLEIVEENERRTLGPIHLFSNTVFEIINQKEVKAHDFITLYAYFQLVKYYVDKFQGSNGLQFRLFSL
jgi:hypothetical protein